MVGVGSFIRWMVRWLVTDECLLLFFVVLLLFWKTRFDNKKMTFFYDSTVYVHKVMILDNDIRESRVMGNDYYIMLKKNNINNDKIRLNHLECRTVDTLD